MLDTESKDRALVGDVDAAQSADGGPADRRHGPRRVMLHRLDPSADVLGRLGFHPIEFVKDAALVFARDADARIAHAQHDLLVISQGGRDDHLTAGTSEFDGI